MSKVDCSHCLQSNETEIHGNFTTTIFRTSVFVSLFLYLPVYQCRKSYLRYKHEKACEIRMINIIRTFEAKIPKRFESIQPWP